MSSPQRAQRAPHTPQPVMFRSLDDDGNPVDVAHWTVVDAAHFMHVSQPTLRDYCRSGRWPYQPVGSRIYMTDADMVEARRRDRDTAIREAAQRNGVHGCVVPIDTDTELDDDDSEGVQ